MPHHLLKTVFPSWPLWYIKRKTIVLFVLGILILFSCLKQSLRPHVLRDTRPYVTWKYQLNLNSATTGELEMLPRIGPSMAQRIVLLRNQLPGHRFTEIEQLRLVKGIGSQSISKLRPYLQIDSTE